MSPSITSGELRDNCGNRAVATGRSGGSPIVVSLPKIETLQKGEAECDSRRSSQLRQ
jgi:hypothetical protein